MQEIKKDQNKGHKGPSLATEKTKSITKALANIQTTMYITQRLQTGNAGKLCWRGVIHEVIKALTCFIA